MNAPIRQHSSLGEFAKALLQHALHDTFDPALQAAATGAGEGLASAGGFLVPPAVAAEIWAKVYATGQILARCMPQPVSRKSGISVPAIGETSRVDGSRFGGAQSYWVDEGQSPTGSKPKFDLNALQLRKLLTLIYATDELVDDVPALTAFLERVMALEMNFSIEDRIINGTGSGAVEGVLVSPATIIVPADGAQAASTVSYANLVNMDKRLWGPSHPSAVWLMSNDDYGLVRTLTTTEGSEVITTDAAGTQRIFGKPLLLTEYTPALGQRGDILLCDFSQYLIAKEESALQSSIHVQFSMDEVAFKLRYRVDGQSAWRAPITPKNSSVTQSPFVALEARP